MLVVRPNEAQSRDDGEGRARLRADPIFKQREERTSIHVLAAIFARALHHHHPLEKSEGAGKAGWPLHPGPPRKRKLRERVNHRYRRRHSGLPCAMVYGLLRALLGEPSRLPPSLATIRKNRRQLSARSLARQDHTTSPSAISAARQSAPSRPPHPRLTFRDDRDTPLRKRGGMRTQYH